MPEAMTVSPVPSEDAAGNISYHFDVEYGEDKLAQIEDFDNTQEYYEMEDGNYRHYLADVDLSPYQFDPNEAEELTSDDFESGVTSEDMGEIIESIGLEEFGAMSDWAHQNLNPQAQARLESIIETGEVPLIRDAFQNLYAFYQENFTYQAPVERYNQPTYEDQQTTDALQSIVGGNANYNQLLNLAEENFSDEQIDRYNSVMSNGTNQQRAIAVRWLAQQFSN